MRGIAGDFLDSEMPVGDAGYLRQVRDRHDLRTLAEASQRLRDGVRRLAADARVDLVEDERHLPARGGSDRQGDARELAAGGGLRNGCERQTGVRTDQERDGVRAHGGRLAFADLDVELALPEADPLELRRDGLRERLRRRAPRLPQLGGELVDPRLHPLERRGGLGGWV